MTYRSEISLGGRTLSIEAGRVARAADGAAWVRYGDTVVLVTAATAPGGDSKGGTSPGLAGCSRSEPTAAPAVASPPRRRAG